MLTLNDGRSELWQWDTGRRVTVDADCSQVHFSNKVFGRSIDVDVIDGIAIIPDILLQTDKDLTAWAFVGTPENGYTKISKPFKVNKRNKPADYVFTPPEQTTLQKLVERLTAIEESQDPDAIKNAVDDYLANNPIKVEEKDPTVPEWAKQPTPPDVKIPDKLPNPHSITFTGAVNASYDGSDPVEITIPGSGGNVDWLDPEEGEVFTAIVSTPDEPDVPDEPDEPEVTLTSISATYTGGNVAVGTAVTDLTGITVTAHYSDGSTATVTDYTLSGEIAEGSNTITVGYGGKTTTFVVTGVAEESGWTPEDFTGTENAFIRDGYYYVNPLNMHYEFKSVITYTDYVEARFDGPFGYAWADKTNGVEFRDLFGSTIPYVGGSGGSYGWLMNNALIIVRVPLAIYEESGSDMTKALYAITERVAFKLAANYEDYLYEVTDELIDAMTGTPSTTLTDAGYYTGFLTWTGVGIHTAAGSNIQCIPCGSAGYGELTFETYGIRITNRFQYCVPSTVDTSSLANFKAYLKTRGIKFLNTTAKEVA